MTKIAIIGAGLAGLTLARALPQHAEVTLFEKSRGIGGRMATRYAGEYEFDHGAQFFTARTDAFANLIHKYETSGHVRPWPDAVATHGGARETSKDKYVASPRMNTLCKTLADGLDVRVKVQVAKINRIGENWQITDSNGQTHGPFEWVICATPAPQASVLLPDDFSEHTALVNVRMAGCFALMLGYDQPINLPWTALRAQNNPVGWMALNSAKPGRNGATALLIHASNEWAEAHLEDDKETVQAVLMAAASALAGVNLSGAAHTALHRWRYAATPTPAGADFLLDRENKLAACGDWCLGSKVEAAFTSGQKLGEHLDNIL